MAMSIDSSQLRGTEHASADPTNPLVFSKPATMTSTLNGPSTEAYPNSAHPSAATVSHTQQNFRIACRKLPISKAAPIDAMEASLGIRVPEMIFGDNSVEITHLPTNWNIEFTAYDALDRVDKTGASMLQVAYARDWSKSRENAHESIKEVVRPFDWSYSTDYCGTVSGQPLQPCSAAGRGIPIELLKRRDPILFSEEVVLFESELDDNGISLYSCKVRVMPERMLLLCRNYMRLDDVLFRIRDTRVYVEFATRRVVRDYRALEGEFGKVKEGLLRSGRAADEVISAMRDANLVAEFLTEKVHTVEELTL